MTEEGLKGAGSVGTHCSETPTKPRAALWSRVGGSLPKGTQMTGQVKDEIQPALWRFAMPVPWGRAAFVQSGAFFEYTQRCYMDWQQCSHPLWDVIPTLTTSKSDPQI